MKGLLKVAVDTPKEEIEKMALELLGITSAKKVIYVPNRIINIIA